MGREIEETYWTAKEWALATRIPYRTILAAVSHGELVASRPSGTDHGSIHISESSWSVWIRRTRAVGKVGAPLLHPTSRGDGRSLEELELR